MSVLMSRSMSNQTSMLIFLKKKCIKTILHPNPFLRPCPFLCSYNIHVLFYALVMSKFICLCLPMSLIENVLSFKLEERERKRESEREREGGGEAKAMTKRSLRSTETIFSLCLFVNHTFLPLPLSLSFSLSFSLSHPLSVHKLLLPTCTSLLI